MNIADNLLFTMRQSMADMSLPNLSGNTAEKTSSSEFQNMMEQARKSNAPANESHQAQKATVHDKKTQVQDKEALVRGEEESTQEEEIILIQNLNAIPLVMPVEMMLRPEVQPIEEQLTVSTVGTVVMPEENMTVDVRADAPMVTVEGEQVEGTKVQPEQTSQPISKGTESGYSQVQTDREGRAQVVNQAIREADGQEKGSKDTELPQGEMVEAPSTQPLFRQVESTPVKVGETYVLDTQAQDMDASLAESIHQGLDVGAQQIEISLTPEHLGTLTIRLTQNSDGALQVVLHTESGKAAGVLAQHLDGLQQALQGLGQGQVHVEVQRGQESAPSQQQQYQTDPDGRGQQQQHQQQHQEQQSSSEDFLHQLRLGLFPLDEVI